MNTRIEMNTRKVCPLSIAASVAAAALLSGCGGGGNGPSTGMPGGGDAGLPPATHPVDRIVQSADSLLMSDVVVSADMLGSDFRIQANCSGTACTLEMLGERETVSLSDFTDDAEGEWPAAMETHRGVSLVSETALDYADDPLEAATGYGGWLDHNFFVVAHGTFSDEEIGDVSIPFAMSIGDAAGTNPVAGGAAWSGVMVGTDVSAAASRSHRIRGDADIAIADFANPGVGVAFTNIQDRDTGGSRGDMTWSGIPLTDGSFGTGPDGDSIEGRFYGPNHEEVGGIFERDRVLGAFGAKRQ